MWQANVNLVGNIDLYKLSGATETTMKKLSAVIPYCTTLAAAPIRLDGIPFGVVETGTRRWEIMPVKIATEGARNWYGAMILGRFPGDAPYKATTEDVEQPLYGNRFGRELSVYVTTPGASVMSNPNNNIFESGAAPKVSSRLTPLAYAVTQNPHQLAALKKFGALPSKQGDP
jgi:hypothetical protein